MELSWRIDEPAPGEQDRFHLERTEFGGPEVRTPGGTGSGAELIGRSRRSSCQGETQMDGRPAALRFMLNAALHKAGQREALQAAGGAPMSRGRGCGAGAGPL